MFFLIVDVFRQRIHMRRTHRERAITLLPMEVGQTGILRLDPFRRITFQFTNERGDIERLRQSTQNMNMVFHPANAERRRLLVLADADQIGMHTFTKSRVAQKRRAVFRREHQVHINLNEGLRHSCGRDGKPFAFGCPYAEGVIFQSPVSRSARWVTYHDKIQSNPNGVPQNRS